MRECRVHVFRSSYGVFPKMGHKTSWSERTTHVTFIGIIDIRFFALPAHSQMVLLHSSREYEVPVCQETVRVKSRPCGLLVEKNSMNGINTVINGCSLPVCSLESLLYSLLPTHGGALQKRHRWETKVYKRFTKSHELLAILYKGIRNASRRLCHVSERMMHKG
eukprot:scaffold2069_cov187-Amphora_coffeaeformis.AAC.15